MEGGKKEKYRNIIVGGGFEKITQSEYWKEDSVCNKVKAVYISL